MRDGVEVDQCMQTPEGKPKGVKSILSERGSMQTMQTEG